MPERLENSSLTGNEQMTERDIYIGVALFGLATMAGLMMDTPSRPPTHYRMTSIFFGVVGVGILGIVTVARLRAKRASSKSVFVRIAERRLIWTLSGIASLMLAIEELVTWFYLSR